jgi:singapore isolate B (sub-type 7) whole genome shotgun sequence assembly, scaffold_10
VFLFYIDMEYRLMNLDRCRKLYEKLLECSPSSCDAWCRYADFERSLEEMERASAIFELAIEQPALDTPEVVWKKYIDHEIECGNEDKVVELYERLLELAPHSKVFISYSQFESLKSMDKAREVLERGIALFKESHENEMRHQLLLALKSLEESIEDNAERVEQVTKRQAKKVKKVRHDPATGLDEDYIDYIFPDDETNSIQMNMLKAASRWKEQSEAKKQRLSESVDIDSISSVS